MYDLWSPPMTNSVGPNLPPKVSPKENGPVLDKFRQDINATVVPRFTNE